jgi:hypothetical protein
MPIFNYELKEYQMAKDKAQHLQEDAPAPKQPVSQITYKQDENFFGEYANNIRFEGSNWDLKLMFGELDQSGAPNVVTQKFSVTVPWAQVKVMHYFLSLHLLSHEADYGRLVIPAGIIAPWPKEVPEGAKPDVWKEAAKLYEAFIAENPEAAPSK